MNSNLAPLTKKHPCLICQTDCDDYFSKTYENYPSCPFITQWTVDYGKCPDCGFVFSKTHQALPTVEWDRLNSAWHHYYEGHFEQRITNQPPYANQALALTVLEKNGLINLNKGLDFAAGYGTLAKTLDKYFNRSIATYDPFVSEKASDLQTTQRASLGKYDLVINSAMFEHVLTRAALDEVNNLVTDSGVLMIHSVICETVPKDPEWFYLKTIVHTAFHTNKSMGILMEQWGYGASIYVPQAKSWFLFKNNHPKINQLMQITSDINKELQTSFAIHKNGFVDYWKGF